MSKYKAAVIGGPFGRQAKAVSLGDLDNFLDWLVDDGTIKAGPQELYRAVAYTFWCVRKRANNIGRIPYLIYPIEVEKDEADKEVEWPLDLRLTIQTVEAWLTLKGAAYVLQHFEGQTLEELQILNANTMSVKTWDDRMHALTFEQKYRGERRIFDAADILYFRTFDPKGDIREGVASGQVGQQPGALVKNANDFAADFFGNGAIPAVFLTTEGPVPQGERERIKGAWNKMLRGIGRFFKTEVLTHGLKPTIIGQPIKDLAMPELALESRMQILAAHDLPAGLAEPKMSLAERSEIQFEMWDQHLIPYCETVIEPTLNTQLFNLLGLRISFQYQELEALQAKEYQKAEAGAMFVSGMMLPAYAENTVAVSEVRATIDAVLTGAGLPPLKETFEKEERTPPQLLAANKDKEPESEIAQNIENRTQPKSAIPKVKAPAWGHHRVSLQS